MSNVWHFAEKYDVTFDFSTPCLEPECPCVRFQKLSRKKLKELIFDKFSGKVHRCSLTQGFGGQPVSQRYFHCDGQIFAKVHATRVYGVKWVSGKEQKTQVNPVTLCPKNIVPPF